MSGLDLQEHLNGRGIRLPVIIITGYADVPTAVRAMKVGAVDYIEKPFNDQLLLDRIHEAIDRDARLRREEAELTLLAARFSELTAREQEVLDLVVAGRSSKGIAAELGLSPKTVEVHRAHVMEKVQAGSVAELARLVTVQRQAADTRR